MPTQMATGSFWGFALIIKKETNMSKKIYLSHENEEKLVAYCAKNNLTFDLATAYDLTLKAFKDEPIMHEEDDDNGEKQKKDVTKNVASYIETHPADIKRIAAKILFKSEQYEQSEYAINIKKAKAAEKPDLDNLVDNLYQLNIVDKNSYLALVCFLMQLRYTRDAKFPEDDKTFVFFNGLARNGKSATAKAICEVESQYGKVFRAHTGKLLGSTHEEQVWKSHLNFFDEVKPTDVARELALTIANGGEVELNPKNKAQYNYRVNTNNIFASNDQIYMMQRRVSIIKFGDRLNGRPLETGTLKKVFGKIMESLPSFDHYYDIYDIVSLANENRINPLAMEGIIGYFDKLMEFVTPENERSLLASRVFSATDIYSHIKHMNLQQTIPNERQTAIKFALEYLSQKGYLNPVPYENCPTNFYKVYGRDFLKLKDEFSKINTSDEVNIKISKKDLRATLAPYFQPGPLTPTPSPIDDESKKQESKISEYEYNKITNELDHLSPKEGNPVKITSDTLKKACKYFGIFKKANERIIQKTEMKPWGQTIPQQIAFLAKTTMTKELCDCVHYDVIIEFYQEKFGSKFTDECRKYVLKKYCELIQCVDPNIVQLQAETKAQYIPHILELTGVRMPSKFGYKKGNLDSYIARDKMDLNRESLPFDNELSDWDAWYKALGKMQEEDQIAQDQEPFLPQFADLADRIPF